MNPCRWCLAAPPRRERWARAVMGVVLAVAAVVLLASGCWTDPASFDSCAKLCGGHVKRLSSEGCVCADNGDGGR